MTFEYEKLLLLKSMQNKKASNIVITKQNKRNQTYHICQEHLAYFIKWIHTGPSEKVDPRPLEKVDPIPNFTV